ncbi:MAG: dTDP-4-amino-4,6-dideoxygalactose transaminase, partial [Kiritimatiellia bacterium]
MSSRAETSDLHMIDLARRHQAVAEDVEHRVIQALRSGHYIGGPTVAEAERTCATLLSRSGAVGVNSGTDALMFALQAVGVRPGDHVIVPALTFFATAGAVCSIGAIPVVVDILEDGLVDPSAVERAMTSSVRAVIPVHLFGGAANLPAQPVPCVDDLAQAIGSD